MKVTLPLAFCLVAIAGKNDYRAEEMRTKLIVAIIFILGIAGFYYRSRVTKPASQTGADTVREVVKDSKSNMRTVQRKLRDATGHSSVTKDLEDIIDDASDEIKFQADKVSK